MKHDYSMICPDEEEKGKMKYVTLTNTFHGTSVRVSDTWGDTPPEVWEALQGCAGEELFYGKARRTLRRVEKALCPSYPHCGCGGYRPK